MTSSGRLRGALAASAIGVAAAFAAYAVARSTREPPAEPDAAAPVSTRQPTLAVERVDTTGVAASAAEIVEVLATRIAQVAPVDVVPASIVPIPADLVLRGTLAPEGHDIHATFELMRGDTKVASLEVLQPEGKLAALITSIALEVASAARPDAPAPHAVHSPDDARTLFALALERDEPVRYLEQAIDAAPLSVPGRLAGALASWHGGRAGEAAATLAQLLADPAACDDPIMLREACAR